MAQAQKRTATAPKPQDHRPKMSAAARKAEADGFAIIEQCGIELRIELDNIPIKALLRFQGLNDDLTEISKEDKPKADLMGTMELLGQDQWAALLAKNPGTRDFAEIGKKFNDLMGN